MEKKKNINYINVASVVSAIAVVTLHANGVFWQFSKTERYWRTANIIETLCYFAVPVFFMISGVTLFNFFDKYSLKEYFKKRICKTFIPFVVFSLLGILFRVLCLKNLNIHDVSLNFILKGLLNGAEIIDVYWFFPNLFCVYLSIPLFAAVEKNRRKIVFSYLAIVGCIVNIAIPFIARAGGFQGGFTWSVGVVSGYLIYPLLGYILNEVDLSLTKRCVLYCLGALAVIIHAYGTYALSMAAGEVVRTYKSYLNLPALIQAIAMFVFFKYELNSLFAKMRMQKIFTFLANYTFPLYLLHWFVLRIISNAFSLNEKALYYRLGAPYVVFAITIVFTFIVRKIPVIKRALPE